VLRSGGCSLGQQFLSSNFEGVFCREKENHHSVSVRSRHVLLKEKLAAKLALEEEKERQRTEEQKKLQEKRKEQAEALTQHKIQQQMLAERLKKVCP
jgi:hypothetical protein